jgi:hypothetical protein
MNDLKREKMEKELREEMKAQYQKAVKQKNSQIF